MANPSVTYTFTNGTVADASQVNQNFTDLINGLTDGSKSLNVDAITAAGTATFNGDTVIGNASGDAATVNATMTFAATPKTDVIAEKTGAAGVTIDGVLCKDNTITATGGLIIGNETMSVYDEGTWNPILTAATGSITTYTASGSYVKVGKLVTVSLTYNITNKGTGATYGIISGLPFNVSLGASTQSRDRGSSGLGIVHYCINNSTQILAWDPTTSGYPWNTNTAVDLSFSYIATT
jgi:hypothetical protein